MKQVFRVSNLLALAFAFALILASLVTADAQVAASPDTTGGDTAATMGCPMMIMGGTMTSQQGMGMRQGMGMQQGNGMRQEAGMHHGMGMHHRTGMHHQMGMQQSMGMSQGSGIQQGMGMCGSGMQPGAGMQQCNGAQQCNGMQQGGGMQQGMGMQQGAGMQQGRMQGADMQPRMGMPHAMTPGMGSRAATGAMNADPQSAEPLNESVVKAIGEALQDEYRSEAQYQRVLNDLGDVAPFNNIVRAEQMHAAHLVALLDGSGVEPPTSVWSPDKSEPFDSVLDACNAAVKSEKDNVLIYDRLLALELPANVRSTFKHLRMISQEHHLPAFQRCAARSQN